MEFISRDELKEKLDSGDGLKLVMVLEDWQFRAMHIPGSLHVPATKIDQCNLDSDDEIVVYCAVQAFPPSGRADRRATSGSTADRRSHGKTRRLDG